jgi:lipopolysaccharide/colanic/teichoic acid biosynthesis glycosyltransferase
MVPNTFQKYSAEAQVELSKVKPGLTGIGSIIFRDEEKFLEGKSNPQQFYDDFIIPYKNELEIWFTKNSSLKTYFMIIFLTAWVIFFSTSRLPNILLKGLPVSPAELK